MRLCVCETDETGLEILRKACRTIQSSEVTFKPHTRPPLVVSVSPFVRVFPGFLFQPRYLRFPSRPFSQCNSEGKQMTIILQPSFLVKQCWDGIVCARGVQTYGGPGRAVPGCRKGLLFPLIVTQSEPDAAGVLAASREDGMRHQSRGGEKGCFHESSPSHTALSFFSLYKLDPI